jgi:hypothetical protein
MHSYCIQHLIVPVLLPTSAAYLNKLFLFLKAELKKTLLNAVSSLAG